MFQKINKKLLYIHNLNENITNLTFYCGIDPTGPGIHIGHLIPLKLAIELIKINCKPIIIIGGFTGMVGDPTDKTQQRQKLDQNTINENIKYIKQDLERIFQPYGSITIVNNYDWLSKITFLEYLDMGYYISVNKKLGMDTFKRRINTNTHLSMSEFSYSDLQMMDFLHLYNNYGCNTQLGGGDQWGNIAFGIDCLKKITKDQNIFGICTPLLTNNGKKVSKSEGKPPYLKNPEFIYDFVINLPDTTCFEMQSLFIPENSEQNPIQLKQDLIKYFINLYHNEGTYEQIYEKNQQKFYTNLENIKEFHQLESDKIINIISKLSNRSITQLKQNLSENAIKINNEVINENTKLLQGQYKISIGKKEHIFIEIV